MAPKKKTVKTPATVAALKREIVEWQERERENDALRDRMSVILRNTADALHGGPLDDGYWSWHDLPERATTLRSKVDLVTEQLRVSEDSRSALLLYLRTHPDPIQAKAGTAYADMVETCHKIGLQPLSPEQFAKEDARLMIDWQRRRNGLEDTLGGVGAQACPGGFGTYSLGAQALPKLKWWQKLRLKFFLWTGRI
jgi:hypothetical protein